MKNNRRKGQQKRSGPDRYQSFMPFSAAILHDTNLQVGRATPRENKVYSLTTRTDEAPVTSSAGGVVSFVLSVQNPGNLNGAAVLDWSSMSGLFDNYRVKKARLVYTSNSTASPSSAIAQANCWVVYDPDNSTQQLTSSAIAAQYGNAVAFSLQRPFIYDILLPHMNSQSVLEGGWMDCSVLTNTVGTIQVYASGLSSTIVYGTYFVELEIEFRLRR